MSADNLAPQLKLQAFLNELKSEYDLSSEELASLLKSEHDRRSQDNG